MKKSTYFFQLFAALIIVLFLHWILVFSTSLQFSPEFFGILSVSMAMIFIGGVAITVMGRLNAGIHFVQKFFILTTFQMLLVMAVLGTVRYSEKENFRLFVAHFMAVFFILLLIQSILLIKLGKKT